MNTRWEITDVKPHIMLCPLPKNHWWGVHFSMRRDSCHLTLHRGHWWNAVTSIGDTVVVLDISSKAPEHITTELIEGSYTVWQNWFRKVDDRQQDWINTAREVQHQLNRRSVVKTKFKIDRPSTGRG